MAPFGFDNWVHNVNRHPIHSCSYQSIYSFNSYFLSTCYVLGTVLRQGHPAEQGGRYSLDGADGVLGSSVVRIVQPMGKSQLWQVLPGWCCETAERGLCILSSWWCWKQWDVREGFREGVTLQLRSELYFIQVKSLRYQQGRATPT